MRFESFVDVGMRSRVPQVDGAAACGIAVDASSADLLHSALAARDRLEQITGRKATRLIVTPEEYARLISIAVERVINADPVFSAAAVAEFFDVREVCILAEVRP